MIANLLSELFCFLFRNLIAFKGYDRCCFAVPEVTVYRFHGPLFLHGIQIVFDSTHHAFGIGFVSEIRKFVNQLLSFILASGELAGLQSELEGQHDASKQ